MRQPDSLDELLKSVPRGDPQYVRDHETGTWSVGIFAPGTVQCLQTVATGMDKSVACWLMNKLKRAFERDLAKG